MSRTISQDIIDTQVNAAYEVLLEEFKRDNENIPVTREVLKTLRKEPH